MDQLIALLNVVLVLLLLALLLLHSVELELLLLAPAEFPAHWVATALERKGLEIVKREVFAGKMNMNCPSLLILCSSAAHHWHQSTS